MATGDFFGNLKDKVRSLYNNFFYDGAEAPAPRSMQDEAYDAPEQPYPQQAPQQPYQTPYPQGYGYQQQSYQAPYQQPYQQPAAYSAPAQQPQQSFQPPVHRNRRVLRSAQQENNVVDFGAYQHNAQPQQSYQQQPQQSYPQQSYQQPYQQPAPQAPEAQPQASPAALTARVINARGMGDCRSAITLLRNGDAVLIVLENVTDPAEMRRLVDTLSGACYSLTATITKVSRFGVYLLAPQAMAVYTDQATNQMNGAPARTPVRGYQQGYNAQRPAYQPQQVPQQQAPQQAAAPQVNAYAPQQGFTQRSAMPEEAPQPMYARTAPQAAQVPPFSAQPAGYGYAPDETEAVDQ